MTLKHPLPMNMIPDAIEQRITMLAVPLASEIDALKHTSVARRIHAWYVDVGSCERFLNVPLSRTWQSFPIGMGTSAVYICLSNLHVRPRGVHGIAVSYLFTTVFVDFTEMH